MKELRLIVRRIGPFWDAYGQRDTLCDELCWRGFVTKIGHRRALVRPRSRFQYPRFSGSRAAFRLVRVEALAAHMELECVF